MEAQITQEELDGIGPESANVEITVHYGFKVSLSELGGETHASWEPAKPAAGPQGPSPGFEPDYAHVFLYCPNGDVLKHETNMAAGKHNFGRNWGKGYKLAYIARNFQGQDVVLVETRVTEHRDDKVSAESEFQFRLAVSRNGNDNAQLTWSTNAPFKPRGSVLHMLKRGNEARWYHASPRGSEDTGVNWGVQLSGVYYAEDFNGNRVDLVRTPTTN